MIRLSALWAILAHAGVALAASAGAAAACAICLAAVDITPGERLDNAERAVLAVPDGNGGWRVIADIKGAAAVDAAALAEAVPPQDGGAATLLLRDGLGHRWSAFGEIGVSDAPWLRALARSQDPETAALAGQRQPGRPGSRWSPRSWKARTLRSWTWRTASSGARPTPRSATLAAPSRPTT